jgi:outer membrane protein
MRKPLLALMLSSAFFTQPSCALDLLQIYNEALANDPVYTSARYALEAGQEQLTQGRSGLLPSIAARGNYSKVERDTEDAAGASISRDYRSNTYSVSLTQPLFRWENWTDYQQGKLSVAVSEAQFAQAQQDLILRVSQAYFDVLTAQDTLASVRAQKTAITEQLSSAKRNFEVGTTTITDTHEAQARYDLVLAQEAAALNDLEVRKAALEQIIGKPAGELAVLRRDVKLAGPQPADINKWVDQAQAQNFSVIAQELNREIAKLQISRSRAGHMPTLDLVASRSHTNQQRDALAGLTDTNTSGDTNSIGLQWTIPIFSGFSVTSQVREAIALSERARADLDNARRTAIQNARQSYLGLNSGLAQVRALEAAEISSRSALESNLLGYQVGARINIDVLNAQQQLYAALRDLARARYETLMNALRLKFAAGVLGETDLAQVNSLLTNTQSYSMFDNAPRADQIFEVKEIRKNSKSNKDRNK